MKSEVSPTPPGPGRPTVLFVDDDPNFLQTVRELMTTLSSGAWEILTAHNASEAFQRLQSTPVHLVVLDVEMQAIDGIQVLSLLNRSHPHVQKVVLTGHATENYRTACLAHGAELFLQKPLTPEGWASVHAALQQLLDFPPERGFRGVLRRVSLPEIIQMECLGRSSSVLEVTAGGRLGRIYIQEGQIVHAELETHTGQSAFQRILALPGGHFVVQPFRPPPERSIHDSWEFLLMEAARVQDEGQAEHGSPAGPQAQTGSPSRSENPPESELSQAAQTHGSPEKHHGMSGIAPPTATQSFSSREPVPQGSQSAPVEPLSPARELLICDEQGTVLYDRDCPERAAWVNILEFISQKARRLAPTRQFGPFDRCEIVSDRCRRVILLRPGRAVLLTFGAAGASPGTSARPGPPSPARESPHVWEGWLRALPPQPGMVLRAIRLPDRTVIADVESRDLPGGWVDRAAQAILDAYEVLAAHRVQPERLRWRYQHTTVDCARRASGALFLLLSQTGEVTAPPSVVELLCQFRGLPAPPAPAGP